MQQKINVDVKMFWLHMLSKRHISMRYEMIKVGINPYILDAVIERNDKIDRPLQEWKKDVGRAII